VITLADYYMGRDVVYRNLLTPELRANAAKTVRAAQDLLILAKGAGQVLRPNRATGMVRSGWRPPAVNAATSGASATSLHMRCLAVDLEDTSHSLALWCQANADTVLRDLGLYLESPDFTPTWTHVQLVAPGSGNRIFRPR
jgi:uncharacterized protein YcbK (DUF882 family)